MLKLVFLLILFSKCYLQFDNSFQTQRYLLTSGSELSMKQKQTIACTISEETEQDPERVFTSDGIYCGQDLTNISVTKPITTANTTKNENDEEYYDYYVILHDPYAQNGSLGEAKQIVESDTFAEALNEVVSNKTEFGEGYSIDEVSAILTENKPEIPQITNDPNVTTDTTQITLQLKGAINTVGFFFAGIATAPTLNNPEKNELQFNNGYNFTAHNVLFYQKNVEKNMTFTALDPCSDFIYYWMASNEDPTTYQYSTDVKQGNTKTLGCIIDFGVKLMAVFGNFFIMIVWFVI